MSYNYRQMLLPSVLPTKKETGASLCNDSLHFYFSRRACWDQDGLAQIKRRIVAAAKWLRRLQAEVSVSAGVRSFIQHAESGGLHSLLMCVMRVGLLHLEQALCVTSLPQM